MTIPTRLRRPIGQTQVSVAPIGLGTMPLSVSSRPSRDEAKRTLRAAIEAGIELIDTANVYCLDDDDIGHSENLISEILQEIGRPGNVRVITKGGLTRPNGAWEVDARPSNLRISCERSLRDLRTERIFLYQLHAVDPKVSLEDSILELKRLQDEGKIEHIGLSNVNQTQLQTALSVARIETVQNRCNPFCKRDFLSGLVDFCQEQKISYIAYSPVGGHQNHSEMAHHASLMTLAQNYKVTPYQIMLGYLLSKGSHILPIPGASRPKSAIDSANAASIVLHPNDIETIDAFPELWPSI